MRNRIRYLIFKISKLSASFSFLTIFKKSPPFYSLLLILFFSTSILSQSLKETSQIIDVRYHIYPEKVRVVFDLTQLTSYTLYKSEDEKQVLLNISNTHLAEGLKKTHPVGDIALKEIVIYPLISPSKSAIYGSKVEVLFNLNYPVRVIHFTLSKPDRLVVDFEKVFTKKILQQVTFGLYLWEVHQGTSAGPVKFYILEWQTRCPNSLKLLPVLTRGKLKAKDTVLNIVRRNHAIAGINGGYFAPDGHPLGFLCLKGEIVSTSPFNRSGILITKEGKFILSKIEWIGKIQSKSGKTYPVSGVNRPRQSEEIILYNSYFGETTKTNEFGKELVVSSGNIKEENKGNSKIPPDGFVISAQGEITKILDEIAQEEEIKFIWQIKGYEDENIEYGLGGGPFLVKNSKIFITSKEEKFKKDITEGRTARTAIGITSDGRLLLVVVDGRKVDFSIGMTLTELAQTLIDMGAQTAINLDGGGSSTLVVGDKLINRPSDGSPRPVPNALILIPN